MEPFAVTATDLVQWAMRRDAQGELPRLIRRLVIATTPSLTRVDFAADEGVQLGGWDGVVESAGNGQYVPSGLSGWELGTNRDVKRKADGDYEKRVADPLGLDPADTTFVFLTPRRWPTKTVWARSKLAEGHFRDVRAYDADDLEQWLDRAPWVRAWVSVDLLGRPSTGIRAPELAWRDWAEATDPPTSAALTIGGRETEEREIVKWLRAPTGVLPVTGESSEDALAFVLAVLQRLPDPERDALLTRCVVVDTQDAWEWLAAAETPLILISAFPANERVPRALRSGHQVILPLDAAHEDTAGVVLPRPSREAAERALVEMGFPVDRARKHATLARRSPLALRRQLAPAGLRRVPAWAAPPAARLVLAAVLAGAWSDRSEGDREILSLLSGVSYEELAEQLTHGAHQPDPPARRIGDTWLVTAKEDAWRLLAKYLSGTDLDRFRVAAVRVLTGTDPALDLPDEVRPIAGLLNVRRSYSEFLSEGIGDTLALMGALGESTGLADRTRADDKATVAVREILGRANADPRIWITIERVLPRLAEAAPRVYLEAVAAGLQGEDPPLLRLFRETPGLISEVSYQAGLLWSLEVLAWAPEHLGEAALALARLARLDPGGRTMNRPANSLRDIFRFWYPQTTANAAFRRGVLERIAAAEPAVAWDLLIGLLPEMHGSASHTARPRRRDWMAGEPGGVTFSELGAAADWTVERLMALAGSDPSRWAKLVAHLGNVPPGSFDRITHHLAAVRPASFGASGREQVWTALRALIARHRQSSDAKWAMPAERLARLDTLYRRFTPTDVVTRCAFLFGNRPELVRPPSDPRKRKDRLAAERGSCAKRVYAKHGLDGIRRLLADAEQPHTLGWTLGTLGLLDEGDEDALLRETLRPAGEVAFMRAYVGVRFHQAGQKWLEAKLGSVAETDSERARLLTSLPFSTATWVQAEGLGPGTEEAYWAETPVYGSEGADAVMRAARSLVRFGRPVAAAELLALEQDSELDAPLVAEVLESVIEAPEVDNLANQGWDLSELVARLEEAGFDPVRLARIEWQLLPVLRNYGERPPRALHQALAEHPEFFADVVSMAYKAENAEPEQGPETEVLRAHRANELLQSWTDVPGRMEDGTLDAEALRAWVIHAREAVRATGRTVGDRLIGGVLRYAPAGADGAWPAEPVRDLIEELASEDLEGGLVLEILDSRGITWRGMTDGGEQERSLAARYRGWAETLQGRWFRTAALLRSVAETYDRDAGHHDVDAELNEDYWE